MTGWLQDRITQMRGSLFLVPATYLILSIALAFGTLEIDRGLTLKRATLPPFLDATVDSARALLGTVASATITFAAIAFSVSLLMIQQAASQFSSRVLRAFFTDPVTKHVVGISLGTFGFCLFVLRAVRQPSELGSGAIVPYVSIFLAAIFGVVSVLAIVAFIHHSAHSMEAAQVIARITEQTREQIQKICPSRGEGERGDVLGPVPDGSKLIVRAKRDGWVQRVETRSLLKAAEPGGIVRLEAGTGTFVAEGAMLCTIFPEPSDTKDAIGISLRAIGLGKTRTIEQDVALGLRQLVDIALRALSPGINDPTTAEESIAHIGSILRELLQRDLPPRVVSDESDRRLFRPQDLSHRDYVHLAFTQIRREAADQPTIAISLLDTIGRLVGDLELAELSSRAQLLRDEAQLILEECRKGDSLSQDLQEVEVVALKWRLVEPSA